MTKEAAFKIPKNLGAVADLLFEIKAQRLAVDKEANALHAKETLLSTHLIDNLPKSQASGIAGKLCRVSVTKKDIPRVEDWSKVFAAIVKDYSTHSKKKDGLQDGAFSLMQRRLGDAAVKEAWDNNKQIEGVGKFTVVGLSLNKL